jgi:hypothetical protein
MTIEVDELELLRHVIVSRGAKDLTSGTQVTGLLEYVNVLGLMPPKLLAYDAFFGRY